MLTLSLELRETKVSRALPEMVSEVATRAVQIIPAEVRHEFWMNFSRGGIDTPWAEPTERTFARHQAHPAPGVEWYLILVYTKRLLRSLTEERHPETLFVVKPQPFGDTEIIMGTKVPYSLFHMAGFTVRRSIGKSGRRLKRPKKIKVPPRPHIGIATAEIAAFTERILSQVGG